MYGEPEGKQQSIKSIGSQFYLRAALVGMIVMIRMVGSDY
jgi:hypothetical protein